MSAKLLNTELEKQIGCMTGMFHMFDRHCLGRGLSRKSNQREVEYKPSSPQTILECTSRNSSSENRRVSTESPRSSISSPLDYIKTTSTKTRSEDSIKGELRGLSVKKGKVVKFRDSPRPTLPADFSPSSNFLARLKEAPRNLSEAPRFSCDGREMSRTKSAGGIREPPRLSLDSSLHRRSPSVIAKLMGLEAMPPSSETRETTAVLTRKKDRSRHSRLSSTPAVSKKKHNLEEQNETVYSQMERRVKELDFHESNKDLRALKHILGTMQVKGLLLETNDQLDKLQITTTATTPRAFESPIVIVKPAKSINRLEGELEGLSGLRKLRTSSSGTARRKQAKVEASDLRDSSGEKKQRSPVMQQRSPRPQLSPARDTSASPVKTSSPRVQQRKAEPEKKPRTPPTTRTQSANRQQQEPMSPRAKNRLKPNRAEKYNQQVDKRVSRRDDGGNVSLTASGDADDCSMKLNSQKKFLLIAEDVSTVVPSEQPSPISVLDASFYDDDELSPSPVKTIPAALKDDEVQISIEDYKIPKSPSEASTPKPSPEIDSWNLGNIKSLIQKLKQLSSTNDGRQEPVLDYVLEILLASGVQGETTLAKAKPEKLRHKLMLDVVQEVLVHKLESISPSPQWDLFVRARKLGGQVLLRELCSEMKCLLAERPRGVSLEKEEAMSAEDLLRRSQGWEDFGLEVPGLVLEIERSIFKDLIDEVVTGEANSNLLTRRRRQLFT